MKGHRTAARKREVPPLITAIDLECLEQADICCEQARAAASLKRFTAARGLFNTAVALCQRAVALNGVARADAEGRLRQLHSEMSAYSELARSKERPLVTGSGQQPKMQLAA